MSRPPASYREVRRNKKISRVLWGVTAAGLVLALAAGIWLGAALLRYHTAETAYAAWAKNAVMLRSQPGSSGLLSVDWHTLRQINPDAVLWLYSDAGISYPVVQGENNSYYLRHLLDGTYNTAGTVFLDYRCAADLSSRHTVIYGHNMKDGSMLSSMAQYAEQTYYEAHPSVRLAAPDGQYEVQLFAAYEQSVDGGYDMMLEFESDDAFMQYVQAAKEKSDFTSNVQVGEADRIVTFVLCTDEGTATERYFVVGRLEKKG